MSVRRIVRARIEAFLAVVLAVLALVSLLWPQWLESWFEVSPDGGSGATEWWIVVAFGVLAIAVSVLSRRDYRASTREFGREWRSTG
jgi:hypothetical protein